MIVGFDYWQAISHPREMAKLCEALVARGDEVYVISAIGKGQVGTTDQVIDRGCTTR